MMIHAAEPVPASAGAPGGGLQWIAAASAMASCPTWTVTR